MRTTRRSGAFRKDYKRVAAGIGAQRLDLLLASVLAPLARDQPLPPSALDHPLTGQWRGCRDCHLRPDLVLIYRKRGDLLELVRLGSHSELGL